MKRLLAATSPADNLVVQSQSEIEMESIHEQSNPIIKITFAKHQTWLKITYPLTSLYPIPISPVAFCGYEVIMV